MGLGLGELLIFAVIVSPTLPLVGGILGARAAKRRLAAGQRSTRAVVFATLTVIFTVPLLAVLPLLVFTGPALYFAIKWLLFAVKANRAFAARSFVIVGL